MRSLRSVTTMILLASNLNWPDVAAIALVAFTGIMVAALLFSDPDLH